VGADEVAASRLGRAFTLPRFQLRFCLQFQAGPIVRCLPLSF
jgi:hypothetical protein